ncbi:MAG TPA: CatA-like O-acetyltransferase [Pyrinomonadaceae bacterium]|nr:CatA-like O-acetyltransferase [Pyrinomonadaceae bacterium]
MKFVDVENWNRKTTFEFFKDYEDPFFNLTANLDATRLYRFCKENNLLFSLANLFYSLQTANEIKEFRFRLIDESVAEFETIHATQTFLNDDETFSFSYYENKTSVFEFNEAGKSALEKYRKLKTFDVENERLDLIYYSVIPWVSFTSFKHATRLDRRQSVPRMVFGKMFDEGEKKKLPHSVEVHHALCDGIHVGKYFLALQEKFDNPV